MRCTAHCWLLGLNVCVDSALSRGWGSAASPEPTAVTPRPSLPHSWTAL